MAEARISVDQNEFLCPVCLDLLKDPVTIHCGHSYCRSCITDCWDQEDEKRVYSCPQCRQTFSPRPILGKNTMLAEVVEKLKKTKLSVDCDAGAGDVPCDVCTGRKYKAVKSCLVCLNSYCQNHLEQHESWFKGKRHNLTEATGRLQEMICQKHEKLLEVFCRTDQKCICMLCTIIEHKNHDIVPAADQRTEKQVFNTRHWWNIADTRFICVYISTILTAYSIHTEHDSRNEQQLQEEFHCSLKIHHKPLSRQSFSFD